MTIFHYLIIGNGAAGLSAAEIIRRRDSYGRITIVTNEPYPFYSRPGIAYYLSGQVSAKQLISRSSSFYRDHRLNLRFDTITGLDIEAKLAYFANGEPQAYDVLLLATGAKAVPPPFPGGDLDGVLTFDTMDDAQRLIRHGRKSRDAVIVGGGITAMELAEGLRHRGLSVHLMQRGDRIWPRLFDAAESTIIEEQIRHQGIKLHYREEVETIMGKGGKVRAVRLKSGRVINCQLVAVAIGVRPNLELVSDLPISTDKGVLVNAHMQTNVPSVFAAGDVAQVYDRWTGDHSLDILWPSAVNEGRAAGFSMVDVARGEPPSYRYQKGSPFNAALLFGVHLTVIGRIAHKSINDSDHQSSHLSRGSSLVWTTPFSSSYHSAWENKGPNSLRVVMSNGRIVGALLMGSQALADPLRKLIEYEADLSSYEHILLKGNGDLPDAVLMAWNDWHQSFQ